MGIRGIAALVAAGALLLTAGCAAGQAPTLNVSTTSAPCAPVAGGTCAPPDPQAGFDANHHYEQRVSPPPGDAADAGAVAAALPVLLDRIQAHPPVTADSVRAALRQAFPRYFPEVDIDTTEGPGVGFGIEVGGTCVHGYVTATDRDIETGGMVNDGGCLALRGH